MIYIFSNRKNLLKYLLLIATVFLTTIIPRVILLNGLPSTDEGSYNFISQYINFHLTAFGSLPSDTYVSIYQILTHKIFSSNLNPFVANRFVDLVISVIASSFLYATIIKETNKLSFALVIFGIAALSLNNSIFIQNGYKNSIFFAFIPLFFSYYIYQNYQESNFRKKYMLIGIFFTLSIFIREPFIIFLPITLIFLMIKDRKKLIYFCIGSFITIFLIFCFLGHLRGGYENIFYSYLDAAKMYKSVDHLRKDLFIESGLMALNNIKLLFFMYVASIFYFVKSSIQAKAIDKKSLFLIIISLAPLLEPWSKIGFPYHFSVCIPGAAIFIARTFKKFENEHTKKSKYLFIFNNIIGTLLLISIINNIYLKFPEFSENKNLLSNFNSKHWPTDMVEKSNYLIASDVIRKELVNIQNPTVVVSGHMYAVYPLTGYLPPAYHMANLTTLYEKLNRDKDKLKNQILKCSPKIILASDRQDWPGKDDINKAINETGLYNKIYILKQSQNKSYGHFGGNIYKIKPDYENIKNTCKS